VVFIAVQNLVVIGVAVLKISEFQYYAGLAWKCYSRPLWVSFGNKNEGNEKRFAVLSF